MTPDDYTPSEARQLAEVLEDRASRLDDPALVSEVLAEARRLRREAWEAERKASR